MWREIGFNLNGELRRFKNSLVWQWIIKRLHYRYQWWASLWQSSVRYISDSVHSVPQLLANVCFKPIRICLLFALVITLMADRRKVIIILRKSALNKNKSWNWSKRGIRVVKDEFESEFQFPNVSMFVLIFFTSIHVLLHWTEFLNSMQFFALFLLPSICLIFANWSKHLHNF